MKKTAGLLLLFYLIVLNSNAQPSQSRLWSLPPSYVKFTPQLSSQIPLPAPGGTFDYSGQPAQFTSNAVHGPDGNLLFFVVDGVIYDKNGFYVTEISYGNGTIKGSTECLIIPVPGQCGQWMVLNANVDNYSPQNSRFFYQVIEVKNTQAYPLSLQTYEIPLVLSSGISSNQVPHMAVSKLTSNNTRFLYLHFGGKIQKFIVHSNVAFSVPAFDADSHIRCEDLNSGIYFYRILENTEPTSSGRFVISK